MRALPLPGATAQSWWLPAALVLLGLATLLIGGGRQWHDLQAARRAPTAAAAAPSASDTLTRPRAEDAAILQFTDSALFGRYDPAAASAAASASPPPPVAAALPDSVPETLPEAALGVSLRGVVYAETMSERRALIDGGTTPFDTYALGDTLPGDAVIRYIEARRIVVEQNGELRALSLPETGTLGSADSPELPRVLPSAARLRGLIPRPPR